MAFSSAKTKRVVGDGVGLGQQRFGGVADLRQAGAHHLRLAAEGIGVLDLLAVFVRVADFARLAQQVAIGGGGGDLAGMAADGVQRGEEGHAAGQRGLDRQRPGHRGRGIHVLRKKKPFEGQGGRGLRAVQQGQALLGPERDGRESGDFQPFGAADAPAAMEDFALAQKRQAQMGQRGQIAGGPARAFPRDARIDFARSTAG